MHTYTNPGNKRRLKGLFHFRGQQGRGGDHISFFQPHPPAPLLTFFQLKWLHHTSSYCINFPHSNGGFELVSIITPVLQAKSQIKVSQSPPKKIKDDMIPYTIKAFMQKNDEIKIHQIRQKTHFLKMEFLFD